MRASPSKIITDASNSAVRSITETSSYRELMVQVVLSDTVFESCLAKLSGECAACSEYTVA